MGNVIGIGRDVIGIWGEVIWCGKHMGLGKRWGSVPFGFSNPSSVVSRDKLGGRASYHNLNRSDNKFISVILSSVDCFNCPNACVELIVSKDGRWGTEGSWWLGDGGRGSDG